MQRGKKNNKQTLCIKRISNHDPKTKAKRTENSDDARRGFAVNLTLVPSLQRTDGIGKGRESKFDQNFPDVPTDIYFTVPENLNSEYVQDAKAQGPTKILAAYKPNFSVVICLQ